MRKVRLTWSGTGSLDVPQLRDAWGKPLFFPHPGAMCVVDEDTLRQPILAPFLSDLQPEMIPEEVEVLPPPPPPLAPDPPTVQEPVSEETKEEVNVKTAPEKKAPPKKRKGPPPVKGKDKKEDTDGKK